MKPGQSYVHLTSAAGALVTVLGLTVLVGWHTADPLLIQIHPLFVPMSLVAALGLVASGIGFIALARNLHYPALVSGVVLLAFGVLFVIQYSVGPPSDFEPSWHPVSSSDQLSVPGTSLNTALSFLVLGSAMLLMSWRRFFCRHPLQVGLFGSTLLALSVVAIFGYVPGFTSRDGSDLLAPVAIQESVGYLISGLAVMTLVWREMRRGNANLWRWLPLFVGGSFLTATLILWQALTVQESSRLDPSADTLANERISLAKVALIVGFVMTLLLALAVHLAQTARRRAQALETEIHDREHAEEALRQSEAKYRSLIENLENSVFLKDRRHQFVAANKSFCDTLGCSEAAIVGKTDYDFYPRELADRHRADDEIVLSEGRRLELETQSLVGDKSRMVRVTRTPVKDGHGEITGILGIFWDVTEQRTLEAQLRQAQKMEAVGQLAGGIAHDFNNLLTVILGNVALIGSKFPEGDLSREAAAAAEQAALRAANLTKQLLGFSRQAFVRSQPTELKGIMDEVVTLLKSTIDPRISLAVNCEPDLWSIRADPSQMSQVLMNLCLNARDAMPSGGNLWLEAQNVVLSEADVRLQLDARPGSFVRLRVRDTGHGMSPEVRARIFEPFFTTKGPGKGTGLGCAMVFGIIRQHHGWIECRSEVNDGTRFDIYLPRYIHVVAETPVEQASPTPSTGTETILLAEDEPLIRKLAQAVLSNYGYEVLSAEDGQEAVEIHQREMDHIDLVILDLNMPRLSGRDAFRQIRRLKPSVRVLFASGYSEDEVTLDEQEHIVGFVSKPYRPDDLAQTVRMVLDKSHSVEMRPQPAYSPSLN